ncbi:hypothetical protein [Aurantibacter aestuarii]|uniref:Uncharacterized protein n=1 Tax=Aurantibacter aestuarii TaxID=1266046 RepID=A0A2T1NEK5_9FLAO|nr:hypothetical protein [Aurantibacter aestuarii]PSG90883.1 hypothetical protein C7H52_06310 [Aurantibacter aestuarii]
MKTATDGLVMVGSAGAGFATGRGVNAMYPEKKQTSGLAKIATFALAVAVVASVKGDDMASKAIKGFAGGFGGEKLLSGVSDLMEDNAMLSPKADDDEATKFAQRALGMPTYVGTEPPREPAEVKRLVFPALNQAHQEEIIQMQEVAQNAYEPKLKFV